MPFIPKVKNQGFGILLGLVLMLSSLIAQANNEFVIGYLELRNDARYSQTHTQARFLMEPLGRPFAGAEVALQESRFHGAAAGVSFELQRKRGRNAEQLHAAVQEFWEQGAQFILIDADGQTVAELAELTKELDIVLFNVSARDDALRQSQCQPHLFHTLPNDAMLSDALAQFLVSKKWTRVLMLAGQDANDQGFNQAFEHSAKRFGLRITAKRDFELSNDPRRREQSNIALLTAGGNYDVVFVSDSQGEFARDVPYQTQRPQLVVGSEGLAPAAWHWAWERHGAPQLAKRFYDHSGRPMRDVDWAAWMAVKAIAEAVQRTGSSEFSTLRDYLISADLVLDGFKGNRINFRPWDRQLRQPILLVTHNWVVARAPMEGFLHQHNTLDSLGFDERDSVCKN